MVANKFKSYLPVEERSHDAKYIFCMISQLSAKLETLNFSKLFRVRVTW